MKTRIGRVAALLGVATAFAVAAPAQAHHIPTCSGFSNPQCNANYFYAHQVQPTAQPAIDVVNNAIAYAQYLQREVDWCTRYTDYCVNSKYNEIYWILEYNVLSVIRPITDPVIRTALDTAWAAVGTAQDAQEQVVDTVYDTSCTYFGAC